MSFVNLLPRRIYDYPRSLIQPVQKSLRLQSSSSSSSSSSDSSGSSSDSDSDNGRADNSKQNTGNAKDVSVAAERLNMLLKKFTEQQHSSKPILDFAIKPKAERQQLKAAKTKVKVEKPFEEKITAAAKNVAEALGGNTKETELELLDKILYSSKKKSDKPEESHEQKSNTLPTNLGKLLSEMKIIKGKQTAEERGGSSVSKQLLQTLKTKRSLNSFSNIYKVETAQLLSEDNKDLGIFSTKYEHDPSIPELSTWNALENRELKLLSIHPPQNVFEELIQWTEQGKLWHFPINNEQGLEKEKDVHFSEHVFMERHLVGWCPKSGPIRHFMELVCVGLSKNPYITVEEKINHIMFYKNYFEDKRKLLEEIGAFERRSTVPKSIEGGKTQSALT